MINKYFRLAKNAMNFSDCKIKIGSVLVYKNKVLSIGYNTNKSHPLQKLLNQKYRSTKDRVFNVDNHTNGIHSELMCLINTKGLDIEWHKVSIYIYRESNNKPSMCKPCPCCNKALLERGIKTKNIYYTNWKGEFTND